MRGGDSSKAVWSRLWRNWIKPALIILVIALPLKSAVADWNWIPSSSMKPTILEGELVLVNKVAYDLKVPFTSKRITSLRDPTRGEIIVFFSAQDGTRIVKRIVAAPGDTIEMRRNVLLINGLPLRYEAVQKGPEHEIYEDPKAFVAREKDGDKARTIMGLSSTFKAVRSFKSVKIPAGCYFVMGDSRDNSIDSRYFGVVERKAIIGRSTRVLLSIDVNNNFTPRHGRFFTSLNSM